MPNGERDWPTWTRAMLPRDHVDGMPKWMPFGESSPDERNPLIEHRDMRVGCQFHQDCQQYNHLTLKIGVDRSIPTNAIIRVDVSIPDHRHPQNTDPDISGSPCKLNQSPSAVSKMWDVSTQSVFKSERPMCVFIRPFLDLPTNIVVWRSPV
jgi:hypothetical protein